MKKAYIGIIAASVLYGIGPTLIKMALITGIEADSAMFFNFFISAILSFAIIKIKHIKLKVTKRQLIELFLFGILGMSVTVMLLTYSYQYIPTGLATMLHFAYPVVVTIIMATLFREKIQPISIAAIFIAIAGLFIVTDLGALSGNNVLQGVAFALLSSITYGSYIIANKKASFSSLNPFVVVFYIDIFAAAFTFINGAAKHTLMMPPAIVTWVYLITLAIFCSLTALALFAYSTRIIGPVKTSVINMLEPITSVVVSVIVFSDPFSIRTVIGVILIIGASLLITLIGNKNKDDSTKNEDDESIEDACSYKQCNFEEATGNVAIEEHHLK